MVTVAYSLTKNFLPEPSKTISWKQCPVKPFEDWVLCSLCKYFLVFCTFESYDHLAATCVKTQNSKERGRFLYSSGIKMGVASCHYGNALWRVSRRWRSLPPLFSQGWEEAPSGHCWVLFHELVCGRWASPLWNQSHVCTAVAVSWAMKVKEQPQRGLSFRWWWQSRQTDSSSLSVDIEHTLGVAT